MSVAVLHHIKLMLIEDDRQAEPRENQQRAEGFLKNEDRGASSVLQWTHE